MDFKEIIKRHLDKMAQQDFAFAERYKLESKNLDSCVAYIKSQAKKQAKNGCAAIEDAVVYGWAVHYYQEENIKVDNAPKAKVVAPKAEKPKALALITAESGTAGTGSSGLTCGSFVAAGSEAGTGSSMPRQPVRQETARTTASVKQIIVFNFILNRPFIFLQDQVLQRLLAI